MKAPNESNSEVSITISIRTFVRLTLLIVLTILLFSALHRATHAIVLLFAAFFLSLALNAPVYWLSQRLPGSKRGSRAIATTLSYVIVLVLIGAFLAGIVPPLVHQTTNFIHAAPHLVQEFRDQNSSFGRLIRKYHLQKEVTKVSQQLSSRLSDIGGTAFSTAQSIASSIFSTVTVLALTFMMLVEGPRYIRFLRKLLSAPRQQVADRVASDMYSVIKGYVNGQVLLAFLASCLISPALFILHVNYPAALIVVIFVCGLIPMIGHTIGAVIVTIASLFHSTSAAIIILIYYILYQQFENYIIQPRIQANSTNMSPLLVFASVVVGVSFGGLVGGLVAIPIAGCLRILFLEYLRSAKLLPDEATKQAVNNAIGETK